MDNENGELTELRAENERLKQQVKQLTPAANALTNLEQMIRDKGPIKLVTGGYKCKLIQLQSCNWVQRIGCGFFTDDYPGEPTLREVIERYHG